MEFELCDGVVAIKHISKYIEMSGVDYHGPQIAGLFLNLSRLRLAHRVRAVRRATQGGALHLSVGRGVNRHRLGTLARSEEKSLKSLARSINDQGPIGVD